MMNKQQFLQATGSTAETVDPILKAMRLKTDANKYSDDHLNTVKAAIAVMESGVKDPKEALKQVKAAVAPAPVKEEGAIAVAQTASVAVGTSIEIPQTSQDTLEVVISTAAEEDLQNLPETIAKTSARTGQQVEAAVQQMTNNVYFKTLDQKLKDPAFKEKVREAIKKEKSQNSKSTST